MSETEVFIISASHAPELAPAIREVVKPLGLNLSRVQDAIFGWDDQPPANMQEILDLTGLASPSISIPSSMRALFFAAQSVLAGDVDIVLVCGQVGAGCFGLLLASPAAVGRFNLAPRALIGARSLTGAAGLPPAEVEARLDGAGGALLTVQMVGNLETRRASLGMVESGGLAMLIERV